MENINFILLGIWLLLCSIQDMRKKKIDVVLIAAGFAVILISAAMFGEISLLNRLAGLSLGAILLLLNPITKGQIGIGDGLIVCGTGFCLGFSGNVVLLLYGLVGTALVSIILLMFFHANRKKTIPFIPFLLIGYVGVMFL